MIGTFGFGLWSRFFPAGKTTFPFLSYEYNINYQFGSGFAGWDIYPFGTNLQVTLLYFREG